MFIHDMVIQGSTTGAHYAPMAVGDVDAWATKQCINLGKSVAALAVKLHG